MIVWLDAQISPALAGWLRESFGVAATPVRDLGLREAEDQQIFEQARSAGAIVVTKDRDFVELVTRHGPPPQILWLTCGNTSNAFLHGIFTDSWPRIVDLLRAGEPLIELGGRTT